MPAITPEFMWDLESRMRLITETEYNRLAQNVWWTKLAKSFNSESKKERINWLLSTAQIERNGQGGNISFEDIVALTTEFENLNAAAGLRLQRNQLEDLDGNGVGLAAHWSSQIGAYAAYWPQKMVAEALLAGEAATSLAYDGEIYFSKAHVLNPFNTAAGTFANLFTSTAGSTPSTDANDAIYPGACPIDTSVTVDVALENLGKVYGYIRSLRMPNGVDPRNLSIAGIFHPPALTQRVQQLTQAKFIAQGATGGAGAGDVTGIVAALGFGTPVEVPEFSADPTSYYVAVAEMGSSQLGALTYIDREPFKVTYYTGQGGGTGVDAILDRARELEWHVQGRNVAGYGHPYLLFKVKAA